MATNKIQTGIRFDPELLYKITQNKDFSSEGNSVLDKLNLIREVLNEN